MGVLVLPRVFSEAGSDPEEASILVHLPSFSSAS